MPIKKSIVQASQKHNIFCSRVFDYRDNWRHLADFGEVQKKCPVRNAPSYRQHALSLSFKPFGIVMILMQTVIYTLG